MVTVTLVYLNFYLVQIRSAELILSYNWGYVVSLNYFSPWSEFYSIFFALIFFFFQFIGCIYGGVRVSPSYFIYLWEIAFSFVCLHETFLGRLFFGMANNDTWSVLIQLDITEPYILDLDFLCPELRSETCCKADPIPKSDHNTNNISLYFSYLIITQ